MRERILELLPDAQEAMKYGMPSFLIEGTAVAGLLANKHHVGLYPFSGSVIARLPEVTERYGTTKGAIHLPPDSPMPKALLRKLIRTRLADIPAAGRGKAAAPSAT